ncbi:DUF5067 domain-containing protein [Staphylococcus warneri]
MQKMTNQILLLFMVLKKKTDKEDVTASSAFDLSFEAYQDSKDVKRELRSGDAYDSELDKKYGDNDTDEINKGGKVKAVKFYKLKDTKTPVTLKVKDPNDYSNDNLAKKGNQVKIIQVKWLDRLFAIIWPLLLNKSILIGDNSKFWEDTICRRNLKSSYLSWSDYYLYWE